MVDKFGEGLYLCNSGNENSHYQRAQYMHWLVYNISKGGSVWCPWSSSNSL